MELRRLRYFVVVAEEQNFSRAAERLRMAQPPLSSQIKLLEKELGVRLFDRTNRGVRLTEAGHLLLDQARGLLSQAEQTAAAVGRVGRGEVGRLGLGFVPSASNDVLPMILREFRRRYPGVELSLHEMNPRQSMEGLQDKWIDAAFFYLPFGDAPPFGDPALGYRSVSREPLVVALPDDHPLAAEQQIELRTLADEPFILTPPYQQAGLRDKVVELCREAGFVPRAGQEAYLVQTGVGLVASGVGVALVPASLRNLQTTGVVYRPVRGSATMVEMGVVWRRDDPGVILNSFLGVVAEVYRDDRATGKREAASPLGPQQFSR